MPYTRETLDAAIREITEEHAASIPDGEITFHGVPIKWDAEFYEPSDLIKPDRRVFIAGEVDLPALESLWRKCMAEPGKPDIIVVGEPFMGVWLAGNTHRYPRWSHPVRKAKAKTPRFPAHERHVVAGSWWRGTSAHKSADYWRKRRSVYAREMAA